MPIKNADQEPLGPSAPSKLRAAIRKGVADRIANFLRASRDGLHRVAGYTIVHRDKHAELLQFERQYKEVAAREKKSHDLAEAVFGAASKFSMKFLFGKAEIDAPARDILKNNLLVGNSLQAGLRDISILHYDRQSNPAFATARSFLKVPNELAPHIGEDIEAGEYTIIDVGAEPLAFEEHVYAPLLKRRRSLVIGFDPMDKDAPRSVASEGSANSQPSEIRIFPNFILDGNPANFHLAQMQATSSTLKFNKKMAERFSLLADALATVESRKVETSRMDDILAAQGLGARPIDFLKIDVQGATLPVLRGSSETLQRTLVCQLEAEFSELYQSESLFSEIDQFMRESGFGLLDLTAIGRQRYSAFDPSKERFFHTGRLLWSDCVYVRHLDEPSKLSDPELLKLAEIAHLIYEKYDLAAFALQELSKRSASSVYEDYLGLWA